MIIRVRSREGTARIEIGDAESGTSLYTKVAATMKSANGDPWQLSHDPTATKVISAEDAVITGLHHGDMLYVCFADGRNKMASAAGARPVRSTHSESTTADLGIGRSSMSTDGPPPLGASGVEDDEQEPVVEDPVDGALMKLDGLIHRERDRHLCKHGPKGMCGSCMPLEPYDETYRDEHKIKHLSFHAHLRKLASGTQSRMVRLEEMSCRLKQNCSAHAPWPKGICTKCQPSAITLARQSFRHVDFVEFDSPAIVDSFIQYWRSSRGAQRIGYLIGRYEPHLGVPLGIKAVVSAIYEPPQASSLTSVDLLDDPNETLVDELLDLLHLQRVGWIFTDLEDANEDGKVVYKRHVDTYFLSSAEVLMAAELQNKYANPCAASRTGQYGSKFVTVCVSGDENNGVGLNSYQVSNQCAALQRDGCLRASAKKPTRMRVKTASDEQYIPEVFFSSKNEYGTDIIEKASPYFRLEFVLVNLETGAPQIPNSFFSSSQFPIENREEIEESQAISAIAGYFLNDQSTFFERIANFHLILFCALNETLPLQGCVPALCDAIVLKDESRALALSDSPAMHETLTLLRLAQESSQVPRTAAKSGGGGDSGGASWPCVHCTFLNSSASNSCSMCSLPKS